MRVCRLIIRRFVRLKRTLTVSLVWPCALLFGCSEFRTIELPENGDRYTTVAVGDLIRVITADVEEYEFEVVGMDDQAFEGEGIRVLYSDVRILSVKRLNAGRTAGLLMMFAVTAGGIHAINSVPPPWPPPIT